MNPGPINPDPMNPGPMNQVIDQISRQMADFMGKVTRPHMKSFLEKRGFFLR